MTLLAGAALLALTGSTSSAADADGGIQLRAVGAKGVLGDERLSNETTLTRFARANRRASILKKPGYGNRRIGRLHFYTEDAYLEPYIALQSKRIDHEAWIQIRVPGRPNGRKGWVPRWTLREFHIVHTRLEVDRRKLRATLYKNGKKIWTSRVGVGKASTPTPAGHFWIRERAKFGTSNPAYGPVAFGTAAYSVLSEWPRGGIVGIHGTNAPQLIPGRPSHGCIRVPNHKIVQLNKLLPIGTPLVIK